MRWQSRWVTCSMLVRFGKYCRMSRFVAKTTAQPRAWRSALLEGPDLVALLVDGVRIGEHCLVVALGIAADGQKHALGLWEGATEVTAVCQTLLAHLRSQGVRTDRTAYW